MFEVAARSGGLRFDLVSQVLLAIFRGDLPAGERLVVNRLAAQFGVSTTPAREALLELSGIGVVDLLPNRGAVVAPFGAQQLREIYQIRGLLETAATHGACGRIAPAVLERLREQTLDLQRETQRPDWTDLAHQIDGKLHQIVARTCGSRRLSIEIGRYVKLVQAARMILVEQQHAQQAAVGEHLEILDCLLANRPEAAADAMSRHIDSACEVMVAELFQP